MFSIIIYGRNDSHGYNLHKRGAISLNAMAEMMSGPDDEIVFVDYNTPDDLPTFAEAIQDTLTENAKKRTRVLRVRPSLHRRFASKTHLVALEPISRNIALRRSNENNKWMLSTNTDMVFVPQKTGETLTDIIGSLKDGFYHLPRFELPECLWEAFDRKDGKGIIRQVRDWSKRFHLNEIVYGHHDNLYDAPGDFQLALRSDLFRIGGFNEDMILGWHVDSNLARRMKLLRGKVDTLIERVTGYHCDHTRQATLMHRRDRVQNDTTRFIDNVVSAEVPAQARTWGMPDEKIEEISLTRSVSVRYIEALETTLPPGPDAYYECSYTPDSYNNLAYPAEHVLPYLADLLSCSPQGCTLAYAGVRSDTFDLVKKVLASMDPRARIVTPEGFDWLKNVQRLDETAWLNQPDIYLFEIGDIQDRNGTSAVARSAQVMARFKLFAEREEERQVDLGLQPRRVLAVNAIHNSFDQLVSDAMSHTTTPFSSRTRHGYIVPERLPATQPKASIDLAKAGEQLSFALGRTYATPPGELRFLMELANSLSLTGRRDTADWRQATAVAEQLIAMLRDRRISVFLKRSEAEILAIADVLDQNRASTQLLSRIGPIEVRSGGSKAPSRLANIEDWERPGWLRWAKRYFGGRRVYEGQQRSLWTWERASLIELIDNEFHLSGGLPAQPPRILVVAHTAEYLAACYSDMGASVDFVDPLELLGEIEAAKDWRAELSWTPMKLHEPIGVIADRRRAGETLRYDAIVCPQNSLFIRGRARFAEIIEALHPMLKQGGVLAAACNVHLDKEMDEVSLGRHLVAEGGFSSEFAHATGYSPLGEPDMSITLGTLDVVAAADGETFPGVQPFIFGWSGMMTTAIWSWRRAAGAAIDGDALTAALNRTPKARRPLLEPGHATETVVVDIPLVAKKAPEPAASAPPIIEVAVETLSPAPATPIEPVCEPAVAPPEPRHANGHANSHSLLGSGSHLARLRTSPVARKTPRSIQISRERNAGVFAHGVLGNVPPGVYEIVYEARIRRSISPASKALTLEVRHGDDLVHAETLSSEALERQGRCAAVVHIERGLAPLEVSFAHHANGDIDLMQLLVY